MTRDSEQTRDLVRYQAELLVKRVIPGGIMSRIEDAQVRLIIREELASLGGRLLAEHGSGEARENEVLAALGGYLTNLGKES